MAPTNGQIYKIDTFVSLSLTHFTVDIIATHVHLNNLFGEQLYSQSRVTENNNLFDPQFGEEESHAFNFLFLLQVNVVLSQSFQIQLSH